MNTEGRELLRPFGFPVPFKERMTDYDGAPRVNLDELYEGSRCGVSIQIGSSEVKLDCGPNWTRYLQGTHNILRERFLEEFERVSENALRVGLAKRNQRFAICHSVPPEYTISAICARVEEESGLGYLACEAIRGVRKGDFNPEVSIHDDVAGGRRMMQNRKMQYQGEIPDWALWWMFRMMKEVNDFGEGIVGLEFVLDTQLKTAICHDFYWSSNKKNEDLRTKFHLTE